MPDDWQAVLLVSAYLTFCKCGDAMQVFFVFNFVQGTYNDKSFNHIHVSNSKNICTCQNNKNKKRLCYYQGEKSQQNDFEMVSAMTKKENPETNLYVKKSFTH